MTLGELKKEIGKYQSFTDKGLVDVCLSAIIATRLEIGVPLWLVVIGPSSGGKSQILRPLSLTDPKFMHRVDDLTENTFLSGAQVKDGGGEVSLLKKIGPLGMIVVSDLSVIFSKPAEARGAILAQFRMIYDGEMIKHSGNKKEPVAWKGKLGVLAGATPTIYRVFEEASDLGERFLYYRMKPSDPLATTIFSLGRGAGGHGMDDILGGLYAEYVQRVVLESMGKTFELDAAQNLQIAKIAIFAEKVRTNAHFEWRGQQIDDVPVMAMPMRLAHQLSTIGRGLLCMTGEINMDLIEWCAYSLANEKKRACLRVLAGYTYSVQAKTQVIADIVDLPTETVNSTLQILAATGILKRSGDSAGLWWSIRNEEDYKMIRRVEGLTTLVAYSDREISLEERHEVDMVSNKAFEQFGK